MKAKELAFVIGGTDISVTDFARAIAVYEGRGEAMDDIAARATLMRDTRDILDRAFRYAREWRNK